MTTERTFPVLGTTASDRWHTVPWDMVAPHEAQALRNHGQTLERLAERGGLDWSELLRVLEDRPFTGQGLEPRAEARVRQHIEAYLRAQLAAIQEVCDAVLPDSGPPVDGVRAMDAEIRRLWLAHATSDDERCAALSRVRAHEHTINLARKACASVMIEREYAALCAWRERFLDPDTYDDATEHLPSAQDVCYAIVDAMTLRDVHTILTMLPKTERD